MEIRRRSYRALLGASGAANLADGIGTVAYPWLASAVTRSPTLIAFVVAAQRLPWLLFSLPAGVVVDRGDRRRLMAIADATRGLMTVAVAIGVAASGSLASIDDVAGSETNVALYVLVVAATVCLGCAEVLRDNAAQSLVPSIVDDTDLDGANGRLWIVERLGNLLLGPGIGSLLLLAAYSLPLFVEAGAFFLAAALILAVAPSAGTRHRPATTSGSGASFSQELRDGLAFVWHSPPLRTMALALGGLNLANWIGSGTYVLFAQEVMEIGPVLFAVVATGGTIGAVLGGWAVPRVSRAVGGGTTLAGSVGGLVAVAVGIGAIPTWPSVFAFAIVESFCFTLWSVTTLSARQASIPDEMFGRANAAHRFFGWGAISIGAAMSGLIVAVVEGALDREAALRSVWFVAAALYAIVFIVVLRTLTDERLAALRAGHGSADITP